MGCHKITLSAKKSPEDERDMSQKWLRAKPQLSSWYNPRPSWQGTQIGKVMREWFMRLCYMYHYRKSILDVYNIVHKESLYFGIPGVSEWPFNTILSTTCSCQQKNSTTSEQSYRHIKGILAKRIKTISQELSPQNQSVKKWSNVKVASSDSRPASLMNLVCPPLVK